MKNLTKFALGWIIFLILTFSFTSAFDINSFATNTVSIISGADSFGNSVSCTGDVDKDGYEDLIIGAYGKNGNTGAVYVIYGGAGLGKSAIDFSTPLYPLTTGFMITGVDSNGQFGWAVSSGDVDQDGYDDIIIGAPLAGTSSQGVVYVIYGCSRTTRASINLAYLIPSSNGFKILGDVASGQFGYSLSTGGINKDGYDDIIIGACGENTKQGAAYIVYGGSRGSFTGLTSSTLTPASTGFSIKGKAMGTYFGWSVSLGDTNNDGYAEIVVGAPGSSSVKGVVYVIYGGEKSSLSNVDFSARTLSSTTSPPGFTITGIAVNDLTGSSVSVGKIDEDLYGDIVIGAPQASSNIGSVYTVFGSGTKLSDVVLTGTLGVAGFTVTGKSGDYFGTSVSAVGNVNKDAYQDIVIGGKGGLGAVYVKLGGVRSGLSSQSMAGTIDQKSYGWAVSGLSTGSLFGISVSSGGDVNNDGYDDIIIGASGESKAYLLIYGRCSGNCDTCGFASICNFCAYGFTKSSTSDCICAAGTYNSGTSCSSCSGCTACSDTATKCTACSGSQLAYNGACTSSSCPPKTYATATTCGDCPSNCDTCSSSSVCTACSSTSYSYQSRCYNPCPVTTYASGTICSACPANCDYCSDSSTCTTCSSGFSLSGSGCAPSCPVTQYYNGAACSACPANCDYCSDSLTCTTCSSTYYLYQNGCVKPCPVTTRATTKIVSGTSIDICEACPSNCDACSSSSVCTTCTSPYRLYQNQCYDPCPVTTYATSTTTCGSCPANCDICSDSSTCTTCSSGFNPSGGVCTSGCPVKTYDSGTGCTACPANCDTCSDSSTCTVCTSPYLLSQNQCFLTCPVKTYAVSATTCGDCSSNCDDCSNSNICTDCSSTYYLYSDGCVQPCPLTTYTTIKMVSGTSIDICEDCPLNCDHCSDPTTCTACTPPFYLYQGQCSGFCPSKTYPTTSTVASVSIAICENCLAHCDTCIDSLTCQTCSSGYYKETDANGVTICQPCSTNCGVCDDDTTCTSCYSGSNLYQNQCYNPCPVKTYADTSTTCADCPSHCDICTDSSTCTTCTLSFNSYQNGCVGTCPSKTYADTNRVCSDCPNNCDQCSDSLTCTTCLSSYLMYEAQCYSSCPLTTYREGSLNYCQKCSSNCDTCTSGTSCTICSNGFHLWDATCFNSCPTGTFTADPTSCGACPLNCDQCSSGTVCSACSGSYFSYQDQCFQSCPARTFADGNTCSDCQENCAKCTDINTCRSCVAGYLFSGPDCVDRCPIGFYPSDGVCHTCPAECSECTGESVCQSCSLGYVKFKFQCLTQCPAKTYLSNSACFDCSEGCLKCKSAKECQVCEDGYILSDSHACVQNIEETAKDKAPPALFESTSLISASMTSGSSLPLNFGLVAKILRNIKYMDLTVSPDLQKTFYSWKVATGFMSAPDSLRQASPSKGLPNVFGRYALDPVFLVNFWKPFFMTIIGLVLFAIFKALEIKFEKEKEKEKKIYSISRQINVAASNFALTQFYGNLDDVILYFAIQLRSTYYDSAFGALSCGIAIVLAMIGVIILSFHSSLLGRYQTFKQKKSPSLETFTQKYENYKLIYNDFKDTNYLTQSFLLFNLLRSLISSLIIATLYQYPGLQIALLLILNLAMLTFLSMRKPFKGLVDTCGQIFCELVLLVANISVVILIICDQGDSSHYSAVERLSQCIIVLNFILLFGCAILLLVNVGKMLYKAYQEKKNEKKSLDKSQASTNVKSLFDSAKFSRPNQSLENKTDQSLMPIAANDLSSELFNNNASRMYQNNNKSPDLSFTQNITGFESPEVLFKHEPMMVSDSYIVENPLDFVSEIIEKKNHIKESNEPVIKPVNITKQMEDFGEVNQGKLAHKNSLHSMDQSIRRRKGGKVRILGNTMSGNASPQVTLKKMNMDESTLEMDIVNLGDAVEN